MGWKDSPIVPSGSTGSWKSSPVIQPAPEDPSFLGDTAKAIKLTAEGAYNQAADPRDALGMIIRKFGHGASFGMTDELSGLGGVQDELSRRTWGMNTAIDPEKPLLTALMERYRLERDSTRDDLEKGDAAHPVAGPLVDVLGALSIPIPGPNKAKAGATLLSRAKDFAKFGAVTGAAFGAGNSDADLTKGEIKEFGNDVQKSALTGGVASGIGGPLIEKGGTKLGDILRKGAEDKAFRAMNGNAKIVNKARDMGYKTDEDMRELGRYALDNGLIPWTGDPAVIANRVGELLDSVGPKIGAIAAKADEGVLTAGASGGIFKGLDGDANADYARLAKKAMGATEAMSPQNMAGLAADDLANTGPADAFIGRIGEQGKMTPGSFVGAFKQKIAAQRGVNWSDKAPAAKAIHRDAVSRYTTDFQDQIGEQLGPETLAEMRKLNQTYGMGADIEEFAKEAATRGQQHKYRNAIANIMMALSAPGVAVSPEMAALSFGAGGLMKALNNPGFMGRVSETSGKALQAGSGAVAQGGAKLSAVEAKAVADWLRKKAE